MLVGRNPTNALLITLIIVEEDKDTLLIQLRDSIGKTRFCGVGGGHRGGEGGSI